jgi:ATP-dependent metalloprotease FtsH
VAGVQEAKAELFELVQIMKNAEKYKNVRGRLPTGCLLVGPPGTGKTLLARAVAGESGVAFFPVAASEFVELFVGRGAARVRELFAEARKARPAIIFIDELDAVGSRRGAGLNEERDQTLNQLLVEMDGFAKDSGILILAATNRPDALDPALLRPGRLTRRVFVGPPTQQGRAQILSVHLRGLDLEEDVDVVCDVISRATPGFTGAELANVANEAALLSVRDGRQLVSIDDMLDGVSRTKDGIATSGNRADAMFRELRSRFLGNYKDAPGSTTDTMKEKLGSKASSQGVPISMGPS